MKPRSADAAGRISVSEREVLQWARAGLPASRAVGWVADRVELVVGAEHRDLDAHELGRLDHERSCRNGDLVAVDGDVYVRHAPAPPRRCTCVAGRGPRTPRGSAGRLNR